MTERMNRYSTALRHLGTLTGITFVTFTLHAGETPPPTILSTALAVAEKVAIPQMRKEENLTAQSEELAQLAALLARAGRTDQALRLIEKLQTEDRVKPPAYVPLAVAAIHAGDAKRARALIQRVAKYEEWTTPEALANIALATHAAGDEDGAVRLARDIKNPAAQVRAFLGMKRFADALPAASAIAPHNMHVPSARGSRWELEYDASLAALLTLVTAFVDRGELHNAHEALDAIAEIADRDTQTYHARALLEIARLEEPAATLHKALEEVQLGTGQRPGERRDSAVLLARIAEALAAAGERSAAAPLLSEAVAVMGPTESVADLEMSVTIVCEALVRIARAHFALGEREQAMALLDRAAHLADTLPVPKSRRAGSVSDEPSAVRRDKVESLARVAAELELAGENEKAKETLGRALASLDAIPSAEWREYAWRAIVEAYVETGRLDRALDILATGKPANPDKFFAFTAVPEDAFLTGDRDRRWRLLAAMPATWWKVDLEAHLATRLEREGDAAEAALLVTDALASLRNDDAWSLIRLAIAAPGVERPGDAGQQRILRGILAKIRR